MSTEEQAGEEACASCGKVAVDEIKLKKCACNLVKYCSVVCQKNHRSQHKKACKKRLAEIRDDRLFTQPDESCYGECPICCLPLPLDYNKWVINSCCSKLICNGCDYANKMREDEAGQDYKCPYCREPMPKTKEEMDQNIMKRVKVNDPAAIFQTGQKCGDQGDYEEAIQYYTKAAKLGDSNAYYNLSLMYQKGQGIEKDNKKQVYHLEEAAIGGHPWARINLGAYEWNSGRYDRAVKHYIIAAKAGYDEGLDRVKQCFANGIVSKEDYELALRGHQAAVDATKSEQRDAAYAFFNLNN